MSDSTMKWLVTTVTSYILVALFVLANLESPIIVLDQTLTYALLVAGLAGLGITNVGAYQAVKTNEALKTARSLDKKLPK